MDFEDTAEEGVFRALARAFLKENAPPPPEAGAAIVSTDLETARAWQRAKADAGFAGILLPAEAGGRGGTIMEQIIFDQEERAVGAPSDVHFMIGLGICAPTILQFATPEQIARHVPPLIRGDEIWCQLFSEPSSGSDLAAARTRARREGDGWVIKGQKIWTSGAQHSDFGLLLARTDGSVPKHMGLTVFILDMKSPGVEVRPIKQISGASHFNEVFLDEVYIPDARRIGQVGQGWKIALGMLMNERLTVGRVFSPDVGPLIRVAAQTEINGAPAIDNGMVRERLARWYSEQQGIRHTVSRVMTALSKGRDPGPEASIIKIIDAAREYEMAGFALDLLGPAALDRAGGADAAPALIGAFLEAPGTRIGGGTEEILLNVIAERVLGLPGDIRVDKDIPFDAAVAQ